MKTSCLALLLTVVALQATDSPYAGSWKISLPQQSVDVALWIVNVDAGGKQVKLVSGLNQYAKSKISDVKVDNQSLTFTITTGSEKILVTVPAGSDGDDNVLRGSIQNGSTVLPVWLQRTTLEELTQKNATKESPGFRDLEAAMQSTDLDERRKKLDGILKKYPGRPVQVLAMQAMLSDLIRQEAKPEQIAEVVAAYRKFAERHGELFQIGANLDLTRNLLPQKASQETAVEAAREAFKLLRPDHPTALRLGAHLMIADAYALAGSDAELKSVVEKLNKDVEEIIAAAKTPEEVLAATGNLGNALLRSHADPVADKGLELARRTVKLLKDDSPLAQRAAAYRLLVSGLKARGLADEADDLEPTLAKIEEEVDQDYEKELLSFKIDPVEKRKGTSDRTVLVEMLTNAPIRPALAATIAFDAARKTYSPKDVVFLQYHVMFPDPDSLIFPEGEVRKAFYQADLEGIPAIFVDGKMTASVGGAKHRGKNSYDVIREAIDQALTVEPGGKIALSVDRRGEMLTAKAKVSGLKQVGADVRLRFALVEERIRYTGASGVRLHHHVVRAFIGGAVGQRLDKQEVTHSASLNLAQLRVTLGQYLEDLAKKAGVSSPYKPLDFNKLKVIAWVQDENSKQVLAATQADVPDK